ncbi:MAG: class I SAM-dependent methyltransferase [Ignavibacteria bacterium]|nr:class I SAM-dependent methyltransferase [Ignavibacteria bacterium]
MTYEEFIRLQQPEITEIINNNFNVNPSEFALKYSNNKNLPIRAIAEQIKLKQKASEKFPELSKTDIIFEQKLFEQASSEYASEYKKEITSGLKGLDLTGGMGIDSFYISQKFKEFYYCEKDELAAGIFSYNCEKLNISNIEIFNGDSIGFLENFEDNYFDLIYADPDRRTGGIRSVDIKFCSPDILGNMDLFKKKCSQMLIKLSPAFDLAECMRIFPDITQFIVVSIKNECKEVLVKLDFKNSDKKTVKAVIINEKEKKEFKKETGKKYSKIISASGKYFYEPDPAIIKAGLTDKIADGYRMNYLNNETDYLSSDIFEESFPGRKFTVIHSGNFKQDIIKKYLELNGIKKANIARRAFPMTPEEIKKKLKIYDGGSEYLFFTKNNEEKFIFIHCRKNIFEK